MESRDSLPNLTSLKIKLLEEGERQQEVTANNHNNNTGAEALNIARSSGSFNNNQQHKEKRQHYDHDRNKNNNSANDKKCYNCGRRGHFAANCRIKDKRDKHEKRKEFNCFLSLAAMQTMNNNNNILWCVDSGASSHYCFNIDMFEKYEKHDECIYLPSGIILKVIGRGNVIIYNKENKIILRNVLDVPELKGNFISISKVLESGKIVIVKIIMCIEKIMKITQY